jgi:hypothetical protein
VWHASTAAHGFAASVETLQAAALRALDGVGDPALGEWQEWTGRAYHVRRRLTPAEAEPVGLVVDVRGTFDAEKRLARVGRWLPPRWEE